MRKMLMLSVLV